jgi:hypothetical protein
MTVLKSVTVFGMHPQMAAFLNKSVFRSGVHLGPLLHQTHNILIDPINVRLMVSPIQRRLS